MTPVITPDYYQKIDPILMQDNLAKTLGASNGYLEYRFMDAVKTAGHSCPSIAGAWMQTVLGLKALYGEETPIRGRIHVTLKGSETDGHTGAMANVISMITGATNKQGFGGLFKQADSNRQGLMSFNNDDSEGPLYVIFTKLDEHQQPLSSVKVLYNPQVVAPDQQMIAAMQKIRMGVATGQDHEQFASFWQARVQRILIDNFQQQLNPNMIKAVDCEIPVAL